jgi:hypothetical protein
MPASGGMGIVGMGIAGMGIIGMMEGERSCKAKQVRRGPILEIERRVII